jgi:GT2 family glycosyltransferase
VTIDIIIVSYNTRDDLARCLASIAAHPPAGLGRVFVVDNASTDGSAAMVMERWPETTVLALEQNVGFAAANNRAIRLSTASHVLLLNSDTLVPERAIDVLAARLVSRGATAAGPKLIDGRGRPEISFGAMLSPWSEYVQQRRVRLAANDDGASFRAVDALIGCERMVDWVSGACLLVDRQAAVDAGLLDERYFMYEEDVDFCAALRARGGRVLFAPEVSVVHLRGRSVATAGRAAHHLYDRSHLAFYEKHLPRWAPLLRWWLRVRGRTIR